MARDGLYQKFAVERLDGEDQPGGEHDGCRYFVIDLDHDENAYPAMMAYAQSCEEKLPRLASDIRRAFLEPDSTAREKYLHKCHRP